jgi:hypothetical protein
MACQPGIPFLPFMSVFVQFIAFRLPEKVALL